ncbi:MAG: hypothetical protein R3B72_26420 [Polyangiaceae bacterium]
MAGRRRATAMLVVTGAMLVGPRDAAANSKFPEAGQLAVAPDDPAHLVARTTFGLLDSRDGGNRWTWICEGAVGYTDFEPPLAVAAGGATLLSLTEGIVRSPDGCAWASAEGALADRYVVDLSVSKADPNLAVAITFDAGQTLTQLWRSTDAGASWTVHGAPLPSGFIGYTLDLATQDPTTIYLSGLAGEPLAGTMVRSTDDAVTWESFPILDSDINEVPYIGAMDPLDDDTLYVRLAGEPGRLLGSFDGGVSWTEIFVGAGFLRGLAVSPDGGRLVVGGESDGTWRAEVPPKAMAAEADAWSFARVSDFTPFCLSWLPSGDLLACGHVFFNDGAGVARSADGGATFDTLFCFGDVDAIHECADTDLKGTCASELAVLGAQIPAGTCGSAPPASGSGGGGGMAPAQGGGGGDGGGRSSSSGCSLSAGDRSGSCWLPVWAAAFALTRRVRRRSRRRGGATDQ